MTDWLRDVEDLDRPGDLYTLLRCESCGLIQSDPYPTESALVALYADGRSSDYEFPETGVVGRLKERLAVGRLKRFAATLGRRPETILDFGTGAGRYAAAAAAAYPDANVVGTDFGSAPPLGSYYERDEPRLSYISYETLDRSRRFDLILARHVVEHTHEPVRLVRDLLALLAPGGAIYVEVPNARSRTARLIVYRWPLWYVPKHLSHFDRRTLDGVIRRAGGRASYGRTEMPMMGNVLALAFGRSRFDATFRLPGIALHPIQLMLEALGSGGGTCIFAFVWRADERTSIANDEGIA